MIFQTTSRADWPQRITLALAVALTAVAVLALVGWWLGGMASWHLRTEAAPMPATGAGALLLLGSLVLAHERIDRRFFWLALAAAGIGAMALLRPTSDVSEGMATALAAGL